MSATCYSVLGISNRQDGMRALVSRTMVTYVGNAHSITEVPVNPTSLGVQILGVCQTAIRPLQISCASLECGVAQLS